MHRELKLSLWNITLVLELYNKAAVKHITEHKSTVSDLAIASIVETCICRVKKHLPRPTSPANLLLNSHRQ